jgi:hypothetical protein
MISLGGMFVIGWVTWTLMDYYDSERERRGQHLLARRWLRRLFMVIPFLVLAESVLTGIDGHDPVYRFASQFVSSPRFAPYFVPLALGALAVFAAGLVRAIRLRRHPDEAARWKAAGYILMAAALLLGACVTMLYHGDRMVEAWEALQGARSGT